MEKIASFSIDHIRLQPGVYVSRKDHVGDSVITTFDLRMTSPNEEPVMNTAEMHTIEHLGAVFLRSHPQWKDRVIYFGPMGCRTGSPSCGITGGRFRRRWPRNAATTWTITWP